MRKFLRNIYLNAIGSFVRPKPGIHLLNGHYVFHGDEVRIEIIDQFLRYLSTQATLIRFELAVELITSQTIPDNEVLVAFTYDDGFEECYTHIAPVLEAYCCNAGFFINANYIDSDEKYQLMFNSRINVYNKKPMTWKQVSDLHERGHIICSHTLDHIDLSLASREEVYVQVLQNKQQIENYTHTPCEYFAWPYGQHKHINSEVVSIVARIYKYIFSSTNYNKYFSYDDRVINRRHIECFWPKSHVNYFLNIKKKAR